MLADKGLQELVTAFGKLRSQCPAELWLAGFSDAKNNSAIEDAQLQRWAEETGIQWLGASDKPEHLMAQVDCVVLPSYREGLPRSLLEACAMAIPAIATDVPGCSNVITHQRNGLLCQARDVDSLLSAMQTMVALSETERARMGAEGRRLVEQAFSEHIVIKHYVTALDDAID